MIVGSRVVCTALDEVPLKSSLLVEAMTGAGDEEASSNNVGGIASFEKICELVEVDGRSDEDEMNGAGGGCETEAFEAEGCEGDLEKKLLRLILGLEPIFSLCLSPSACFLSACTPIESILKLELHFVQVAVPKSFSFFFSHPENLGSFSQSSLNLHPCGIFVIKLRIE